MTLARLMFADAEEIGGHLIDRADNDYLAAVSAGEGAGQWTARPYRLLPLLAVACQITLDPRRMPDVVAEHIGLDPQFDLDAVCEALSRAVWHHAGNPPAHRLRLDLICPHQALDHALRLKVADLNTLNRARRLALIQSRLRV